ncbi:MAG: hypothetical protein R8M14_09320 [Ghiorsea sp.]
MFKYVILLLGFVPMSSNAAETITLTQTACQFIEAEGGNQHYQAHDYDACEALNKKTGEQRLKDAEPLVLKTGDYVFHVKNQDVPYVLGFWLRGEGFSRLTLPSTSGGGIQMGDFKDYNISLKSGEYVYSCPLNPTPDYKIIVKP